MFDTALHGDTGFQSVCVAADLQCVGKMDISAVFPASLAQHHKPLNKYRVK